MSEKIKDEGDPRPESRRSQTTRGPSMDTSRHSSDTCSQGPETYDNVLERSSTHQSMGPDAPVEPQSSVIEIPDEVYDRLPAHRKNIIVCLLSFCSFLAPISSTSVLAANVEVAAEYQTTTSIVNLSNAMYMLFMGLSPMFWGPMSQVYGRRIITIVTAVLFFGCSIGTALSPNLAAFFVFRILTAFEGTSFILVGSAVIGPIERGTALGWFLSGTLIGPAFGPFLGGLIVTYTTWRVIFWLQCGLAGLACLGSIFLLPETIYHKRIDDLVGYSGMEKARIFWSMANPWRVIRLFQYPNLLLTGLASSGLLWNMYSILAAIRYVLNPRFHLTSPLQAGLFYLAPGMGYVTGTFFGGRWADVMVRKYIRKRGVRISEDRLYSSLPFMVFIGCCMLVYGWTIREDKGGIPLAVILLFLQGFAQLFCFPSLNTYCLDVMPGRSGEVVAGNYALRYMFACLATGVVLPAVSAIGVGWFSTISALTVLAGALCVWITITWGRQWREGIDARKKAQRYRKRQADAAAANKQDAEKKKADDDGRAGNSASPSAGGVLPADVADQGPVARVTSNVTQQKREEV